MKYTIEVAMKAYAKAMEESLKRMHQEFDKINNMTNNLNDYVDWKNLIGPSMVILGQKLKSLKPIGALGSQPGSSVASYTLSKIFPQKFTKIFGKNFGQAIVKNVGTNTVGRALGRFVPYLGWGFIAYDFSEYQYYEGMKNQRGLAWQIYEELNSPHPNFKFIDE